ncbi:Hypothetical predicted protein [Paramuricea clavata]|uniref:Uncharacterized protein n=1 Tax=Paramuricea clavata TaxID=317549 RepID=A0A6S7H9K6_PARCT|nr:Hypothetical predicted protein [Paramuricea clavata]
MDKLNDMFNIEVFAIRLTSASGVNVLLSVVYRPPTSDSLWLEKFREYLTYASRVCDEYIIVGDLNFPDIDWNTNYPVQSSNPAQALLFCEIIDDFFLYQMVRDPTGGSNILDLVLTNNESRVSDVEVIEPANMNIHTDHSGVVFNITRNFKTSYTSKRIVYNYKKGDFDGLRNALRLLNIKHIVFNDVGADINDDWHNWKTVFMNAVIDFIPVTHLQGKDVPPWFDSETLRLIRKKNSIRRRATKNFSSGLWTVFSTLRKQVKNIIERKRREYFFSICSTLKYNPKRFWSVFKIKSKASQLPLKLIGTHTDANVVAITPDEKATLFNEYFHSVFDKSEEPVLAGDNPRPTVVTTLTEIVLDQMEVEALLLSIDPSKAQWKLANIVPILKKCPASNVQNYRPISLLSNIGKIFERCVFNRVINHISNQLHNFQHGFLKGKSCTTHLLQVIDEIGRSLDCAEQTDIIYLDFAKAFDKVNHSLLLDKISGFGIDGNLLKWFGNYLSDRRQQVTIPGSTSGVLPVLSGVPQGSILGPLLFLMFINDLPDSVMENSDAKMVLFADDSKIYKTIRTTSDCMDLQTSIDRTSIWSCENKMLLNSKKCTIVSVNRKTQPTTFSYTLGGLPLGKTNCEKDLGVLIKSDLKWDAHVLSIPKRANNALGYIRRGTTGFNDVDTRKVLYMALVRNHLVHASQVWAPQSVHLIKQLESLQRRATKYILCLPYDTTITYKDRLLKLDLLPMSYWHEYLDVLYLYKLASGMLSLKLHDFLKVKQPLRVTRRSNPSSGLMFDIPKVRTVTYQSSYFIRTARIWNELPSSIRLLETLCQFKNSLLKYYKDCLKTIYDTDNPRTWKTICPKCHNCSVLVKQSQCC